MEELIKDFECHLTLMADDLYDIVNHSNSIVQYIKEHEGEWSRSGTGNNVQISSIGNEGKRIAKYKIDNNPEGYIYAPTTTPGLNGDVTIIEPLDFDGNKIAIANFVAGNESGTLYAPVGGGSNPEQSGLDGLSTLFAFRGFASDSDAENAWNSIKLSRNYPPGNVSDGWSTSSNVPLQTGHMLYMTTAQRQGNNYITVNGAIWQKPVRIGSGSDTSHTGTDDDNYNYIYCRTVSSALPGSVGNPGTSSYGVELLNRIENESNKEISFKPDETSIDLSNNNLTPSLINNAWTDHPHGVNPQLPFEWLMGFKKNETSGNWEYYFGPIIISHYGHDGLDGDGLEYIFYLLLKNEAGTPSIPYPYNGKVGGVTKEGVTVNSSDYQLDDFIPNGWADEPGEVSELYPRQYVSTRKKEGALEANNLWQAFTTPKLWNVYATNGFLATLDNDSIIFDDDTDHDAIEYISLTKEFLWDGANNVTLSNNYTSVTVTINCVGFSNELRPGIASIDSNGDVSVSDNTDWGTPMTINRNDYKGFALTKRNSEKLETKTGSITYTIRAYQGETMVVEASRVQTIQVIDINDGTAYSLLVTPNTLGASRTSESSPYLLRDSQTITVTATAASGKKVEKVTIKNGSDGVKDNNLYVEVKKSNGDLINTFLEFPSTKSLVYDLSGISGILGDNLKYIVVDLYYEYQGVGIKIDSETVDFSVTGDKGPAGLGSGTESYVITTLNDNAVIDDLTTNNDALAIATLNTLTVYKGNEDVTSSCTFVPIMIDFPSELQLKTYSNGQVIRLDTLTNINSFVIGYSGNRNITSGNYYYDIDIIHDGETRATKRFKLYVDANISADGSFYKLSITNDIVNYDSEGNSLSDSNIVISAYKISSDGTSTKENIISKGASSPNSSNGLYVKFDNSSLDYIASLSNGEITISRTSIPYNANGYDITLYNGNFYADGPEHIDCIKDGAPGDNGKDSTVYGLEPYPTVLKFNVASDGITLTPSEVVARCKISKKVGDNDYIFSNNNIDGYYLYYNITNTSGLLVNLSGALTGSYVIYNNDDEAVAGIHISNLELNYTRVNFYLAKLATNMQTTSGGQSYTTSLTPVKQVSVPILRDGLKGESGDSSTGLIGKFYYFAGDWTGNSLTVTEHLYPYVYYNGEYFMYVGTASDNLTTANPVDNLDIWEKITYNKYLISEAIFSKYAQLGALIVNSDWMISLYGTVGGTPTVDNSYTQFDPIAFMTHLTGEASIGVIPRTNGSNLNLPSSLMFLIRQSAYIDVKVNGLTKLIKVNQYRLDNSGEITYDNNAIEYAFDGNGTATINGNSSVWYCFVGGIVSSIKIHYTGSVEGTFIPNYALDLRSGLTYLNNAYVKGLVSTVNDLVVLKEENLQVGSLGTLNKRGLFCRNDKSNDTSKILASMYTTYVDGTTNSSEEGIVELKSNNERYRHYISPRSINLSLYDITDNPGTLIEESIINSSGGNFPIINTKSISNNSTSPVAFPGNIDLRTTVTLPSSSSIPYSGTVIFAPNCSTVETKEDVPVWASDSRESINESEEPLIHSESSHSTPKAGSYEFILLSPRIFVGYYVNSKLNWKEFCCRQ